MIPRALKYQRWEDPRGSEGVESEGFCGDKRSKTVASSRELFRRSGRVIRLSPQSANRDEQNLGDIAHFLKQSEYLHSFGFPGESHSRGHHPLHFAAVCRLHNTSL
ncbi:hypothetical protein L596_027793 [Steinernema carpocapsae]|uniref:Uncharacterized protein n=1 Tax=Steinernema carpocapsae TaxID=34508 RepID=A0A4U5LWJ3_STECR|nr:hypothetical protein L596_027793 [Steinernema carpocapsae]